MSKFAQQALTAKHAYVAALLAASATLACAQTSTAPVAPATGEHSMHQGMGDHAKQGGMMERIKEMRGAHSEAKMKENFAKRSAALKAKLKLTPDQEGNWASFTAAMTPQAMPHQDHAAMHAEMEKLTTPERIDKMQAMHDQRQAEMKATMDKRAQAAKTFYSTLSAEQKKIFDAETLKMMHQGPMGHGEHEGHGGKMGH